MIKQLRVLVLKAASGIEGMTGLVEEGKRQFTMMCADINSVHPELRDVVMNVAVANGGLEGMSPNQRFVHAHLHPTSCHHSTRINILCAGVLAAVTPV